MSQNAALAKAMKEGAAHIPEGSRKGALAAALNKLENVQHRMGTMKENAAEAGSLVIHTVEELGTVALVSGAEGYWGRDKMTWGGWDVRLGVGLLGKGYQLYETLNGRDNGHVGAMATGVLASAVASHAIDAGRKLAQDKGGKAAPVAPPVPPAIQGTREVSLSGPGVDGGRVVERGGRQFLDIPLSPVS